MWRVSTTHDRHFGWVRRDSGRSPSVGRTATARSCRSSSLARDGTAPCSPSSRRSRSSGTLSDSSEQRSRWLPSRCINRHRGRGSSYPTASAASCATRAEPSPTLCFVLVSASPIIVQVASETGSWMPNTLANVRSSVASRCPSALRSAPLRCWPSSGFSSCNAETSCETDASDRSSQERRRALSSSDPSATGQRHLAASLAPCGRRAPGGVGSLRCRNR